MRGKKGRRKSHFARVYSKHTAPTKHKRDFDWRPKKRNPLRRPDGPNWRLRIKIGAGIGALLIMLGLFFYHSTFHIQSITVTGLQRIDQREFTSAVEGMIDRRRFLILPGKSFFMVKAKDIEEIAPTRFPLEEIHVTKRFPRTLDIAVNEKISTVIYDNGKQYAIVGLDGAIVEILRNIGEDEWTEIIETTTTTLADGTERIEETVVERFHTPAVVSVKNEFGDYPIVYDTRSLDFELRTPVLTDTIVSGIVQWFNATRAADIPLTYIELDSGLGDAILYTKEGWRMEVSLTDDVERQVNDMAYVLEQHVTRPHVSYINLRYKGRIYWQ